MEEADAALRDMLLDDKFGKGRVVVEDFLTGPEFSFMCFVSGRKVLPMVLAQDHKRAFDGDEGPNTGGMGAYSPLPFITPEDEAFALEKVMKTPQGIRVIEFNARFGDPETEVVLPRLKSDIYDIFSAVADGRDPGEAEWHDFATLGIVLASKGYPGSYEKGYEITGTEQVDGVVYHMGTAIKEGRLVTSGGRVMIVVCRSADPEQARCRALEEVRKIGCENLFYRSDIGMKALSFLVKK